MTQRKFVINLTFPIKYIYLVKPEIVKYCNLTGHLDVKYVIWGVLPFMTQRKFVINLTTVPIKYIYPVKASCC